MAAPGYCSTFLEFATTTTGGNITVNGSGSSGTLTSLSNILYNELMIFNAPDAADNGTWTITGGNLSWSGNTLTLTGTLGSCSGCTAGSNLTGVTGTLEQATMAFPYGGSPGFTTSGNTSFNLSFGTATSLSEAGALNGSSVNILTLLGLNAAQTSSVFSSTGGGGISGTGAGGMGPTYNFTAGSETLNVTVNSTPEPASLFLFGSGLLGIAWAARRRSARI